MANVVWPANSGTPTLPETLILSDATTNTAPDGVVERHTTSGTPAANFGITDAVELQNASGTIKRVMTDVTDFVTATGGSEEAERVLSAIIAGTVSPVAVFGAFVGAPSIFVGQRSHGNMIRDLALGQMQLISGGTTGLTLQTSSMTSNVRHIFAARLLQGQGASIASATTVTLGSDGNVFPISGTTTINGITTASWGAGAIVYLKFAGILTVTHNSGAPGGGAVAIKTTTAANVTTAANSIMTLMYDGTFWVQTCPITPGY